MSQEFVRFLRRPEVESITGLKRSSLYAKIASDEFPKPVKIGSRAVAWMLSEVMQWQESRVATSRGNV